MKGRLIAGVIGAGTEDDAANSVAEEVGERLAREGCVLVNGGLGGVMLASARGAKKAGGLTVGILPGLDPNDANAFIDIPLATGLGDLRNLLIIRSAHTLIAVGGSYGTLSEMALGLKAKKPVVRVASPGLDTWDFSEELVTAPDAATAVALALKAARKAAD